MEAQDQVRRQTVPLSFFILVWYNVYADRLEDEDFIERYGDIYEGLVLSKDPAKRQATIFYPFWFCMRRLIFSIICILFPDDLWL